MRQTSVLVPPMSNDTASGNPHAAATAAAARTPPAGPAEQERGGQGRRVGDRHQSAGRRHHEHLVGQRREGREVVAAQRPQPGVRDGRDGPLVLAELGRHLVGARHVEPAVAQHAGDGLLVGRVEVRVQEAHGDRVDVVGDRRDVVVEQRLQLAPVRVEATTDLEPQRSRHQRLGSVAPHVVQRRPRLARDLDHVGEARASSRARPARRAPAAARSSRPSCRARASSGRPAASSSIADATAAAGADGVDGTFTTRPSSATRSVNVPPVSTPTRIGGVSHRTPVRCAEWVPRPTRRAQDDLLGGLNPVQHEAVIAPDGPLLIVAGAGSGKTRVLTHRIAYLVAERKVSPFQILAITFTNKAAGEMKERVASLVGPVARRMWVATFHSACSRILRREAEHVGTAVGVLDLRPVRRRAPHRLRAARPQPRPEAVPAAPAARVASPR